MAENSLLQIVSAFKPTVDGMGDMARRLAESLWIERGIPSHFLVYRRPKTPLDPEHIAPNTISYPEQSTPQGLLNHIEQLQRQHSFSAVLLHYGPYAYTQDGKPAPFVQAIETLAKRMRLVIYFHETYASGPPWKRAFWTRSGQKSGLGRLMACAGVALTSNTKYVGMLEELNTSGRPILKAPVISNVGEPASLVPLAQRPRQLMVFGQLASRIKLYRDHPQKLEEICRALAIERVLDVGSDDSPIIPGSIAKAEVKRLGWLNEEQASAAMSDCIAGVICYWPDVWEKSGVLAAYEAHGLVPILVPLEARKLPAPSYLPYVLVEQLTTIAASGQGLEAVAAKAHEYYVTQQSVRRCADVIANAAGLE